MVQNGGAWSFLLLIPVVALLWVFCDTPQREEAREALRQARQAEKDKQKENDKEKAKGKGKGKNESENEKEEALRLKTD